MTVNPQSETLGFQAEVKQLLHLVTHSLYSNKEIFLRELISNSSDAADKLRFEALTDEALYEGDSTLKIWVDFDEKERTVTIRDNGIGMNREEVIENLGTIARSGTREFLAALSGDQAKDAHLIGQFGVGFYSSFVVADKVVVKTRRAGMQASQGVEWESAGEGDYMIKNTEKKARGTEVILHLKKDESEFLDPWRLRSVITKYSDHIVLPIVMKKAQTDDEKKKGIAPEDEVVNRATALWTLAKKDIKDEDYKELYKHITHDYEEPLLWTHNQVEGKLEYITLLYIPAHAPFDLWYHEQRHGLKLYAQRVFIMDDAEQLLPNYLRFVKGVVDSKDLPLNVSRELLQNNKIIETIRGAVIKRVLDVLEKLAQDDVEKYAKFWSAFGNVIKEGLSEDFTNRERIAKLLRFSSTQTNDVKQTISFADYVGRMRSGQDKIFYVSAESFNAAKNSPHLEVFRKKDIEVLLLSDRIDEWMLAQFPEYEGKKIQSIAKGDLDLGKLEDKENKEQYEKAKGECEELVKRMQKALGDKVKEVRVTARLTDSPVCLATQEFDMSVHLQQVMQMAGHAVPASKPILEINADHPLIVQLKNETDENQFNEWAQFLFDQAWLIEGGKLDDPAAFVQRVNKLMKSEK